MADKPDDRAPVVPLVISPFQRVPQILGEIVTIIYEESDASAPVPVGTGFFINYSSAAKLGLNHRFLVTARHLIFDKEGKRLRTLVRVNVQGSGTTLIPLHEEKVLLPSDPTIDLAELPEIDPDVRIAAQYLAANDFIATREDLKLPGFGVGAEVMYLGLFNPHVGESRNQPVARFGRVALVPDEPVFWEDYPVRVILAAINAFGGSSGSPVFVYLGHRDHRGLPLPKLLGVVKGSFTEKHRGELVEIKAPVLVTNVAGMAGIIPAYLLDDLIRQDVIPAVDQSEISEGTSGEVE